jgi:hypothetical protein
VTPEDNSGRMFGASLLAIALALPIGALPALAQDKNTGIIQPPPGPDPSTLTQEELRRSRSEILDILRREIAALKEIVTVRLDAADKASVLLAGNVERVPTLLDRIAGELTIQAKATAQLLDEKIARLAEIEALNKADSANSLIVALNAQKESVIARSISDQEAANRSAQTFAKQISDLQDLIRLVTQNTSDKIAADTDRLTKIESALAAVSSNHGEVRSDTGQTLAMIAIGISLLGLLVLIFSSIQTQRAIHERKE